MRAHCIIAIVKGYHEVTPVPQFARDHDLKHRFAVILNSERASTSDVDFESDGFLEILREILRVIDYGTVRIEVDEEIEYQYIEALSAHFSSTPEEDRLPPDRMSFRRRGLLTCLEETEFWSRFGGPQPYSDSYTLSFYTRDDLGGPLESACAEACQRAPARIEEIIQGSAEPVRVPWWKKLIRKMS